MAPAGQSTPSTGPSTPVQTPAQSPAALALQDTASCEVHDVWAWNLDEEFAALLASVSVEGGSGSVILAFDVEFPGFLRQEPRSGARHVRYQVLRENVDSLRPIQLGVAVASSDGVPKGVWSFNLKFDVDVDRHTAESVEFLRAAGIDFPRHATEGIEASALGQRLANSDLVGWHAQAPWWVTFSGFYDFGYLLRMLTRENLPQNFGGFDVTLSSYCPRRHELRDELPYGSLDSWGRKHGLVRCGLAHTAGSDALLTLELYLTVTGTTELASKLEAQETQSNAQGDMQSQAQIQPSSWWGSTCAMEVPLQLQENWDATNTMWYQGTSAANWGQSWEGERWDSSWEFQTPLLAAPAVPLLPR